MRYGQFCLLAGSTHFSDIHRGVPLMSPTLLSHRLKELEQAGLVQSQPLGGKRREWRLTEAGRALGPVIHQMGEWGVQYAQDPLDESDLDARVLMWNMRRRVDPATFPDNRVTVEFEFTDMPSSRRHWWLISDHGEVDLCPTDPGFPVDVYLTTDVRTMVMVWFGTLNFDRAVASGRIELLGQAPICKRLGGWLLLSPLALHPV
jgi:DNA-binding HxlR family transcriptional regulator